MAKESIHLSLRNIIFLLILSTFHVNSQEILRSTSGVSPSAEAIVVSAEGLAITNRLEISNFSFQLPNFEPISVGYLTPVRPRAEDLIQFIFEGAEPAETISPVSNSIAASGTDISNGVISRFSLEFLFTTNNSVVFRVLPGLQVLGVNPNLEDRIEIELDGVGLINIDNNDAIYVIAQTITPNGFRFNQTPRTPIATIRSQFEFDRSTTSIDLDGVIDILAMRKEFIDGNNNVVAGTNDSATRDSFIIGTNSRNADILNAGINLVTLNINARSFAFLLDENQKINQESINLLSTNNLPPASFNLENENKLSLQVDADPGEFLGAEFIQLPAFANILPEQDFTADISFEYNRAGTQGWISVSDIDIGGWLLNAATVNIPFLPYGSNIEQLISISNEGIENSSIELSAFDDEGNHYGPVTLSVIASSGSVTRVQNAVREALIDEGFDGEGSVDITLTITSVIGDIEAYANYRVNNDRVSVQVITE